MTVGFLGAGKMGEAMMAGLIRSGLCRPSDLVASDCRKERLRHIHHRLGVSMAPDNAAVARLSRCLVVAVKPYDLEPVLQDLAEGATERHVVLSIVAGRRTDWIERRLPRARVVRVMPNLPCTVGEGMSVYCLGRRARRADARTAVRLLTCFGRVREVPERLFDAVTALSGSGPAFFAYVLDALARGAQKEGLTRSDALLLAEQTMLGTARLLLDTGQEPEALIQAVASPKGTTVAGLTVLTASPVSTILARAIRAAARRSRELSRPTRGEKSVSTAVGTAGSGRRLLAAPRRV